MPTKFKPKNQAIARKMVVPSQHHITDLSPVDATIFRQNKTPCYPCMTYMSYVCAPFSTLQISRHNLCFIYVPAPRVVSLLTWVNK